MSQNCSPVSLIRQFDLRSFCAAGGKARCFACGSALHLSCLFFVLLIACALTGCAPSSPGSAVSLSPAALGTAGAPALPEESSEEIVASLVTRKLEALSAKDMDAYLALIDERDQEYYTEQRNWFLIYHDAVTSDFSIDVKDVEQIDDSTIVASLKQHYRYGPEKEDRTIYYEEKFVKTPAGWKDADLNFEIQETPHFMVKYPQKVASQAAAVAEEAEQAYTSVMQALQLEPPGKVTIKLYDDKEILRHSSDIRVAYLFNGWNEDGESIKIYARRDSGTFAPLIAHELVHKITLAISDSQSSWFAEGLASYFGNQPFQGGNPLEQGKSSVEDLSRPVSWLEETSLIELTDEDMIRAYYGASSMLVEFIVETYGLDKLKAILQELSKYPRYNRGYDYGEMEQESNQRLHDAIKTVLGVDMDAFNQRWLEWIKSQG